MLFAKNYATQRKKMVRDQIEARGIRNPRTLAVMRKVERHLFVKPECLNMAYRDGPLPINCQQTISQPYIVALMTDLLKLTPTSKVLEIGTGCGYQTAILAELAGTVYFGRDSVGTCQKREGSVRASQLSEYIFQRRQRPLRLARIRPL